VRQTKTDEEDANEAELKPRVVPQQEMDLPGKA
jgi:hypothetical protein